VARLWLVPESRTPHSKQTTNFGHESFQLLVLMTKIKEKISQQYKRTNTTTCLSKTNKTNYRTLAQLSSTTFIQQMEQATFYFKQ